MFLDRFKTTPKGEVQIDSVIQSQPAHRPPAALGIDRSPPRFKQGDDGFQAAIVPLQRDLRRRLRLLVGLAKRLVHHREMSLGIERILHFAESVEYGGTKTGLRGLEVRALHLDVLP